MAGAMAGSAILQLQAESDVLELLTLTVNNACNLACPHCYLQYNQPDYYVSDLVTARVMESACRHLAIVGKEPLMTKEVALKTWGLLKRAADQGKSVSFITNGLGLDFLPDEAFDVVDYIDVSFDGGPETYQGYRGASYAKLTDKIARRVARGFRRFRALSVISSATMERLDDVLAVSHLDGIEHHLLSAYVATRNDGSNSVSMQSLRAILERLHASLSFRDAPNTTMLFAEHELSLNGDQYGELEAIVQEFGLGGQARFVGADPLRLGVLRVTYDGYALTPLDSLHPTDYRHFGLPVDRSPIDEIYARLRGRNGASACRTH